MARLDINLLPRKGARELFTSRWYQRLRRGSFGLLGIYATVLLAIAGVRVVLGRSIRGIEADITQVSEAVATYQTLESEHVLLKKKLAIARGVLRQQKPWGDFLAQIVVAGSGATLREVLLEEEGTLRVTVDTSSLQSLVQTFERLSALEDAQQFLSGMKVEAVEKTSLGFYTFTLVFASS